MDDPYDWDNGLVDIHGSWIPEGIKIQGILYNFPKGVERYNIHGEKSIISKEKGWYRRFKVKSYDEINFKDNDGLIKNILENQLYLLSFPEKALHMAWVNFKSNIKFSGMNKDLEIVFIRHSRKSFEILDCKEVANVDSKSVTK